MMFGFFTRSNLYQDLTPRLVFVCCLSSLGTLGYGFDNAWWGSALGLTQFAAKYGSYSAAQKDFVIPPPLSSAGTGTGSAGLIIGCLIAPWLCEHLGRKRTLLVLSGILFLGILLEASAVTSYWQLVVGRIVIYAGIGLASNVVPMYLGECSPPRIRGAFLAALTIFKGFGSFLAALVVFLSQHIDGQWAYLTVIVCQLAVPVGICAGYYWLPESPRWLVYRGRLEEAQLVIKDLFGEHYDAAMEVRLLDLQVTEQRELHKASSLLDCFRGTNRRRTIIAIGNQVLDQAQGISFINNYIVTFMKQLGFKDALRSNVIVNACGFVASTFAIYTLDRLGRRPTLLIGAIGMGIMMFGVGGITANGTTNLSLSAQNGCVAMLILWFVIFQFTFGPGAWLIAAEVCTAQLRERTILLASLGSFATSVPINFVNPFVQAALAGKITFIYGSFSVVAVLWVWFIVPEMNQRSLEELDQMFQAKLPTRKFKEYVSEGLEAEIRHLEEKEFPMVEGKTAYAHAEVSQGRVTAV